jgi:hypothetical protein
MVGQCKRVTAKWTKAFMVVGRGGGGSWSGSWLARRSLCHEECRCSSWVDQSLLCLFWNSTVFVTAALILEEYTEHSNWILFCWCLLLLLSVNSWLEKWRWIMGFGLCGTHVLGSGNGHLADAGPLKRTKEHGAWAVTVSPKNSDICCTRVRMIYNGQFPCFFFQIRSGSWRKTI